MRRIQIHTAPTSARPIAGVIGVVLPACAPATCCLAVADIPPAAFEVAAFVAFFIPAAFSTVARAPIAPAAAASAAAAIAASTGAVKAAVASPASGTASVAGPAANQMRILAYLIPLRILRGHLPSDELMHRFPILADIFAPFVAAIRTGDIAGFDRALEQREARLIELNLLLTLEKARELRLRGLFCRVWVSSAKGTRIPLSMFHCVLRISGIKDVELEEAECLVANMVYKGFMRGYISHEKRMVVLAVTTRSRGLRIGRRRLR
ncbi:hypothetical protein B0H14DRAFT_3466939 [Mycena olivaceomarginata]|nr:hypothetical protein B0H14DRAFT_3466939 [Mycena olivaceomarginata]